MLMGRCKDLSLYETIYNIVEAIKGKNPFLNLNNLYRFNFVNNM